ncbi:MAG: helix-turn-helix transcriptional regulator [Oscillospiraceae bacterium]|nr:helix-turn-helix transcriptional regulator [Oscillospiraceae bacterium]
MSMLSIAIGRRIRGYRTQQGMSQEMLAEKCGLHPTYIGQVERGEKNATIDSIFKISYALSVPLSKLFENLDLEQDNERNCPAIAYDLLQTAPKEVQEKIITIINTVLDLL